MNIKNFKEICRKVYPDCIIGSHPFMGVCVYVKTDGPIYGGVAAFKFIDDENGEPLVCFKDDSEVKEEAAGVYKFLPVAEDDLEKSLLSEKNRLER